MPKIKSHYYSEVELHYVIPPLETLKKIKTTRDIVAIIRDFYNPKKISLKEFYWGVFMTDSNHVLGICEIGVGTSNKVLTNNKELFQLALKINAVKIAIAHNHPSDGSTKASKKDIEHAKQVQSLAKFFDMKLTDAIIISHQGFESLIANKLL